MAVSFLVVSFLFGFGGLALFRLGSPARLPSIDGGSVSVLTDDPTVAITIDHEVSLPGGDAGPLSVLNVRIDSDPRQVVRWAVVLRGDAGLRRGLGTFAATALRTAVVSEPEVRVSGDVRQAWFLRNAGAGAAGGTLARQDDMGGSVLVGESTGGTTSLMITGAGRSEMTLDTGPAVYTNLPVLGVPPDVSDPTTFLLRVAGRQVRVLAATDAVADGTALGVRAVAESTAWYYPRSYELRSTLTGRRPADNLSQVEPPALSSSVDWRWSATDRLFVRAVLDRPDWVSRAQTWQFLGAAAAGIAGGVFVWSIEIAWTAWFARRRPTPGAAA